ncbi:MAG TPA: NifB/NifX family molybdenum-iron cluster-binding protein [bacterium]|nr:NifB/NifX family molybdenum-iron cluster-binding protein [bacterium]
MRICIPVEDSSGLGSRCYPHFGSAPCFVVYDQATRASEVIDNRGRGHMHGMCQPLSVLEGHSVNVVVCEGMGPRALERLNSGGIKVFRVRGETAAEAIQAFEEGKSEELTLESACRDHQCG